MRFPDQVAGETPFPPPPHPRGGGATGDLGRFVALYAAMYAAYGVASPFLPAFAAERGLRPDQIGVVLAAGTLARLAGAPLAGRLADRWQALRPVLVACIAIAAAITLGYLPAEGVWLFLVLAACQSAFLAPMTVLSDALALGASKRARFEYGWARGTGSAAFIAGTLLSGQVVAAHGLAAIIGAQALLLVIAAAAATRVPEIPHERAPPRVAVVPLLRIARFRNVVIVAALVLGSHAMHDAFAVIRWTEAGIDARTTGALWSLAVVAEVVVFFAAGPALIARLTPAGAIALAALAGIARWTVMALSTGVAALALVQPLHGLTFALLHLACMRVIARSVPPGVEGTAQALYATLGIGLATALFTVASGFLYRELGAHGFWLMAMLCAASLPFAMKLRA